MVAEKLQNQAINKENKGFFQKLAAAKDRIPWRTVLIVPLVLQILGTVAIVEYLSFNNSRKAVSDVVSHKFNFYHILCTLTCIFKNGFHQNILCKLFFISNTDENK